MAKVRLNREGCIGCGACASLCPEYWQMADDGKTTLKNSKKAEDGLYEIELKDDGLGCNPDAMGACPVNVIHIVKEGEE